MGGIAGVFCRTGTGVPDRSVLVRQTELLTHRGPDDGAIYIHGPFALGHRRFDAEGVGIQPRRDREGRVAVVCDGELDNASELVSALEAAGHASADWDTSSIILAAYREWGDRCVERLSGAFAFVALDKKAQHLFVARDPLGLRPLYFYADTRFFVFASEVRALIASPMVPRVLEPQGVVSWFRDGAVSRAQDLLRDIYSVGPGEALLVDARRIRVRRYWRLGDVAGGPESSFDNLRAQVEEAAIVRPRSPSIIALSGGRVSSVLATLRYMRIGSVRTFTMPGLDAVDRRESTRLAGERGFEHTEAPLGLEPIPTLENAIESMDLPIGSLSYVGQMAWAKALMETMPDPCPIWVGHGGSTAFGESSAPAPVAIHALSDGFMRGWSSLLSVLKGAKNEELPLINSVELQVLDRLSVVAQRPVHAAFLRPRVLEAVVALRDCKADWSLLAEGITPTRIASRSFQRASPPIAKWMRNEAMSLTETLLFDRPTGVSGFLNTSRLRRWWYEHQLGLRDWSVQLWRVAVFEQWYRRVFEGESFVHLDRRRRRTHRRSPYIHG